MKVVEGENDHHIGLLSNGIIFFHWRSLGEKERKTLKSKQNNKKQQIRPSST